MTIVSDLIQKLGGPGAVARECGSFITGDAVTAWGARDQIPWKWRSRVAAMANKHKVRLNPAEQKAVSLDFKP